MFTLITTVRKNPDVSTEDFREFMELVYGPIYAELPQTREYIHYYVSDSIPDLENQKIDAIVRISFQSREEMRNALQSDSYKQAQEMRRRYMESTPAGIHSVIVEKTVKFV
ncbi:EthD domain-containing protein [Burkholderia anthina]|uniref:EthD domain-containing protein n=1 Tax=Burkholderia anthina TaxID=179879 RepID=UPI0009BF57AF|nr:EthD domain-containing protein [Burkholderia anthina]